MLNDLAAIRELVKTALTEDQFAELCFDHFREVNDQFAAGQTRGARIRALVEFADRQRRLGALLGEIERINPGRYAEYVSSHPQLEIRSSPGAAGTPPFLAAVTKVETCDVLILAANPRGTDPLQLQNEADFIRERLNEGAAGRSYRVHAEFAVRADQLARHLLERDPVIVHFSGHGSPAGEMVLENAQGQPQPVPPEAFAGLFAATRGRAECLVLNACFTLERADALVRNVRCVIGTAGPFDNESARRFAAGFYRGLAFGKGFLAAFELGRNEIALLRLPDAEVPRFVTRDLTILDREAPPPRVSRTFNATGPDGQTPLYPLWFGTNRKPVDAHTPSRGFSGERDDKVYFGTCRVAVPKSHKIGSTGSSWWRRLLTRNDDRLKLDWQSLQDLPGARFWADLRAALQEHDAGERAALVYLHGYNVSFEEAALRAAQLGFDLQVPGLTAFFSWPSKGSFLGYVPDEASVEASERPIAEFLTGFVKNSGAERVHLIAHSMGNRGLLRSMQRVVQETRGAGQIPFGQIFLAAPDVDTALFRELAGVYRDASQRTTLYVSSRDKALASSGLIHDWPRAGYLPPVTVLPGIDTVEASAVDLTFLGHGYYADGRELLHDLHSLLLHGDPPPRRLGLREATTESGQRYWIIGQ